jgi:primosomal protein N' (replication factor Y)
MFAQVVIDVTAQALEGRLFTYRLPETWSDLPLGSLVTVPFGHRPNVQGFVVGLTPTPPDGVIPKTITSVVSEHPLFTADMLAFYQWVAQYYAAPLAQVLAVALPATLKKPQRKTLLHIQQLPPPPDGFELTPRQLAVWQQLPATPTPLQAFVQQHPVSDAMVKKLAKLGAARIAALPVVRDPLSVYGGDRQVLQLSAQQQAVVDKLNQLRGGPYLVHGVTGSGKTQVYIALAEAALARGEGVLVMVPEIALTSQIARRFIERFGREQLALWHSNLSAGERSDTWWRVYHGELRIVIAARSGIFAPVQNLGLILVDEAHDGSYKQDSPAPRYHALTLAEQRSILTPGRPLLVTGSATPDVADCYRARQSDQQLTLPERFGGRPLADVITVDMRFEKESKILSLPLRQALTETLAAQQQAIILMNRRGFYTLIRCVPCSHVFMCPDCSVALTYHKPSNRVRCHYCGFEAERPLFCPSCASDELAHTGTGTQRVEMEVKQFFPEARVLRLDSDILQKKHAARETFETFAAGEADILIGTQMVAKGLDVANVTCVGVVGTDSLFYLPDFKAAERGFQLLTQVAGRAGRGDKPGRVFLQTFLPDHPVIEYAKHQDFEGFYRYEIALRQSHAFPPFSQLIRLVVTDENEPKAKQFMQTVVLNLRAKFDGAGLLERVTLLGPAPCVISRIQGRYRFHCLIKNQAGQAGQQLITDYFKSVPTPENLHFLIDVDTQSLL